MFKHTIYSDVFPLECGTERAWDILLDFDNYPQWNPFTHKVLGSAIVGNTVDLHVNLVGNKSQVSHEQIKEIIPLQKLSWGMVMLHPWLLTARRDQLLITIDGQHCQYHTFDELRGLLSPIVAFLYGKAMRDGFNRVGKALQQRVKHSA